MGTGTRAGGAAHPRTPSPHPIPAGAAGLSATVRQVKLTQELRVHLLEQLSGLQSKQQRDAELLEDIR